MDIEVKFEEVTFIAIGFNDPLGFLFLHGKWRMRLLFHFSALHDLLLIVGGERIALESGVEVR